jgi:transposase
MNLEGLLDFKIKDRPYDSTAFLDYLKILVTCLKSMVCNELVLVMDNVPFHKTAEVRFFLESENIDLLFLPPYSPS